MVKRPHFRQNNRQFSRRASLDGRRYNETRLSPGRHHHKKTTEIFYILEGELTLIFDDEAVVAFAGTTINVPPNVWHEAKSENGAKMLTVFSPAGFEDYLARSKTLTDEQFTIEAFMQVLNEKYDIWNV